MEPRRAKPSSDVRRPDACAALRHAIGITCAYAVCALSTAGCATAAAAPAHPTPVLPAPPPKDDGQPAQGGGGGREHAAALEELKGSGLSFRVDRQNSMRVLLPDAEHWLRVKFWGVKSLVGYRYGKDHHAIVGAVVVHVEDENAPGACRKAFEAQAQPLVDSFEVTLTYEPPRAVPWHGKIADIDALVAATQTLGVHDEYAVAYATYPAWPRACLIVGLAVPARGEIDRAKAVRDRFATEVLPKVEVLSRDEPREMY